MSSHKTALVPLESWCYASPSLLFNGSPIDIGLFAEALIYYDSVLVNIGTQPHFAQFLQWFISQKRFDDFLALCNEGTIKVYDYGFSTNAILTDGVYSLWNLQDIIQAQPNTFSQRVLYHPTVEAVLPRGRLRQRLYRALEGNVTEAKAADFEAAIENAKLDYSDPRRNSLIVQCFVDDLYGFRGLGRPPEISSMITPLAGTTRHQITWNIDTAILTREAGLHLNFHNGTPLSACGVSNRLIWSAAQLSCDLYLPGPMSRLVGDKLYESAERAARSGDIIQALKAEVEYPDIRQLVNQGEMNLSHVLSIRKKAKRFRDWLQSESDRDRNAIIAYHNEIAREMGIVKLGRKTLLLFGILGGGVLNVAVAHQWPTAEGQVLGGLLDASTVYLANVVSKLGSGWTPVVFGDWLRHRIEREIRSQKRVDS